MSLFFKSALHVESVVATSLETLDTIERYLDSRAFEH